jgi:ribose transport system permease protein
MAASVNDQRTITEEFAAKIKLENTKSRVSRIAPLLVLLALVVIFSLLRGEVFLSIGNLSSILNQLAIPLLIAMGLTFVILLGSIDLSIDGTVGMAGSLMSLLVLNTKNANNLGVLGLLLGVLASVVVGFLIGTIYVKLKIPSFMVSFSFMYICMGIAMLSYGGIPAYISDPFLMEVPKMAFLGIPIITWVAIVMFFVSFFIQEYTAFGRHIYAVGTDENIPRMAGVNVNRVKVMVFSFAGLCFGIAGVLGGIRLGQGQMQIGTGTMFPSQAAVVVGGTALSGGKGGILNTLVGVLIMTVLENGLVIMRVNPYIKTGIQGLIIIVAIALTVSKGSRVITK